MSGSTPHVLIVEDDAAMGSLLVRELSRKGFAARLVRSAAEALEVIDTEDFDAFMQAYERGC